MNSAIVLVGPSGSGKTPLGQELQERGLCGCSCRHFDFGARLRDAAEALQGHACLADDELAVVRQVLRSGALLEDEQFNIAKKLLQGFLADSAPRGAAQPLTVLNGLPRHIVQAQRLESVVKVELVVQLCCPAETVMHRIRTNAGGDRVRRVDDDTDAVRTRLALYAARTEPLLDYYRQRGLEVEKLDITPRMTGYAAWLRLNGRCDQSAALMRLMTPERHD
ncbi:MAG: nucleoside monophosphate kinase [Planctomycetes bacterium]|nr:nucleoside monophosphate kinase [Planctomycetota bacterium]